ncbi:MAG: hypothetical protein MJ078_07065, partial [Clostridia bacterium]|nr:hypothetical protein [Clostridia bacterium]
EKDVKIWGTTQDLEKVQNNVLDKLMEKTEEEELFRDENVTLRQLGKKQKRALGQGVLRGFGNQLTLEEKTFPFSDLEGADILKGGSALVFTYQNIHYELYGNGVCMQKYAYLYEKKKTNRKAHS